MFDKSNMRFHNPLDDILGSSLSVRALRHLLMNTPQSATSRGLAKAIGSSNSQCIRTLDRLERVGVVSSRTVGRAIVWTPVKDHVLTEMLSDVFKREATVTDQLMDSLAKWAKSQPVKSVALFGSVLHGEETPTSDVDVHVVTDSRDAKERVDASAGTLTLLVARRFGNPLSLLIHDRTTLERLRGSPFLMSLQSEERLVGAPRDV